MLARHVGVHGARVDAVVLREQHPEAAGVEDRAAADDPLRRQAADPVREVAQDVDRVRRDEDDPVRVRLRDLGDDRAEDRRVLGDEVQARLARLLRGARRDDRDRGALAVGDRPGPHPCRAGERDRVHEVHRLALGLALVGVDEDDLRRQPGQQQRERERGAHGTRADDGDTRRMGEGERVGSFGRGHGRTLPHRRLDVHLGGTGAQGAVSRRRSALARASPRRCSWGVRSTAPNRARP